MDAAVPLPPDACFDGATGEVRRAATRARTTLGRRAAARRPTRSARHTAQGGLALYVDALDDAIADALRAHPERFYVLAPADDGRTVLRFVAPGRNGGVDIGDLEEFLLRHAP